MKAFLPNQNLFLSYLEEKKTYIFFLFFLTLDSVKIWITGKIILWL